MARKKLPKGEKRISFVIQIQEKYLESQNLDELRLVGHNSIVKHVEQLKNKTNA